MRKALQCVWIPLALAGILLITLSATSGALESGSVTGKIERLNDKFSRDYKTMDYKGQKEWAEWGKDLNSLGWVVVQGDSGDLKDYLLLIIDNRTKIEKEDGGQGLFSDLKAGSRITASYKMGWDALHALDVKILKAGAPH